MGVLADWISGLGKGVVNMIGSGVAGVRDLGAMATGQYKGGNDSETAKWQMFMTGANNARDAQLKSAGQALKSATSLSDLALMAGTGGTSATLSKGAGAVMTNALQGIAGGFADELEANGENWSTETAGKRMLAGGLSGAATAGLGNKMNNSTSKLLNNKLTNSAIGRGAISGGLGGAVGGGTMAALSGGDVIGTALGTAVDGAIGGAVSGGVMSAAQKAGRNTMNKIWTAEQNRGFQTAITNPDKVTSPIYLGEVSQDSFNNISNAYKNAGIDLNTNPDAISAIKVENNKLYLTPEGAQHLNQRRIQNDGMSAKNVRQTMRNATQNGTVAPQLTNAGNATMGAQNKSGSFDIAHIGVNNDGSLNLNTTYKSHGGKTAQSIKNTLGGSAIQPSTDTLEGNGLPARTSALQGADSNIPQQGKIVNSDIPESREGKQLRLKSAEALLDQYGTIDKPMARSANAIENVQRVADAGFTKPGEVEDIISKVTGGNGKVSKMTQTLVSTAQPVDTVSDIDRIVNEQIALNGLAETPQGKATKATIDAQLNRLESRRKGSITGTDAPEDVFDVIKSLESRSADLKGKSGNNYRLTTPERTDQARVIDSVTEVLKDRLYSGADMSKILTPEAAAELKSFAPKNEKWANYVDNTIMKSRDIGELRSTMAPFVNMGKVIENQYMNYGTYGSQMSQTAKANRNIASKLSDIPVVGKVAGPLAEITLNSNMANRVRANAYAKAANVADSSAASIANIQNSANPSAPATTIMQAQPVSTGTSTAQTRSLPNQAFSMLGRETGRIEADDVENTQNTQVQANQGQAVLEAMQQAQNVPKFQLEDGSLVTLEETEAALQRAYEANDMASYNELGQIYQTLQKAGANGATGTVGNIATLRQQTQASSIMSQLQQVAELALQSGDIQAFNQAATLYKAASAMFESEEDQQPTLSSSQQTQIQNLDSSLNSLDQMEALFTEAGGGKGMVGGSLENLANLVTGGSANKNLSVYNSMKNSIGMAIVKNFVNLGSTESDAKKYADALPDITDSSEVAKAKIDRLRTLITQARQNVYNVASGTQTSYGTAY